MNNDYREHGWLLPDGCKDLIDVIKLKEAKLAAAELEAAWLEGFKHDVAEEAALPLPAGFRTAITDAGFVITVCLAGLRSKDVEITAEGNRVRISIAKADDRAPVESVVHVPSGYCSSDARADYLNDELQIIIPKQLNYQAN